MNDEVASDFKEASIIDAQILVHERTPTSSDIRGQTFAAAYRYMYK